MHADVLREREGSSDTGLEFPERSLMHVTLSAIASEDTGLGNYSNVLLLFPL